MIVDAADYYALLARLMEGAKERILLIGWDFDPRIALTPDEDGGGEALGHYMLRLAKDRPDRDLDILRWNFGGLKQLVMPRIVAMRSEEHTSELQSLMCNSYAVFCLKKNT